MKAVGDTMRTGVALLLALGLSVGCSRGLTELPPQDDAAPELLGRFSGVYGPLSEGEAGRTIVLQLRDKVLLSPVALLDGEPRISIFATIFDIEDSGASSLAFDRFVPVVLEDGPGSDPTGCIPADNINTIQDAGNFFSTCMNEECDQLCMSTNLFRFEESIKGNCRSDNFCELPLELRGALGRDGIELNFSQETLVPPGGDACITNGKQGRCFRFDKVCDFDSRVAGVFTGTLTQDGGEPQPIDVGVAVAANIPVIALLVGENDRFFFGPFDPFNLTFEANDGDNVADPMVNFRPVADTRTVLTGTLEERESEGLVFLEASWVETAADSTTTTFTLSATRLAGASASNQCDRIEACPPVDPQCVFPGDETIFSTTLDARLERGCVRTECVQSISSEQLCGPFPDCNPLDLDGRLAGTYQVEEVCPVGNPNCESFERCLSVTCAQDTCDTSTPPVCTPPPSSTWWEIDAACFASNPPVIAVVAGRGEQRISCSGSDLAACEIEPVDCPLPSFAANTEFEVLTRSEDGCPYLRCRQSLEERDYCDIISFACPAGEVPEPFWDDVSRCVDFACQPDCTQECSSCGDFPCGYTEWPDCPGPVELRTSCNDCLTPTCGEPTGCDEDGMTCAIDIGSNAEVHIRQEIANSGCLLLTCEQTARPFDFCTMDPPPTCNPGEAAAIRKADGFFCLEYECLPHCSTLPEECQGVRCTRYDEFPSCPGDVTVWDECAGVVNARCGPAVCPNDPVQCPLGLPSGDTVVNIIELLDQTTGCNLFSCQQSYDAAALCGDPPPTCSGGDVLMSQIRPSAGCVEFVCRSCSGGSPAITDPNSCGANSVDVQNAGGGCLFHTCN